MRPIAFIILASLMALAAGPAAAKLVDFTYHGTVGQLDDGSGVFGTAATGDQFTLVFRGNTDLGLLGGYSGGVIGAFYLTGGTSNTDPANLENFPTLIFSPVSARLMINGRPLVFAGRYLGDANAVNDCTGVLFGGTCVSSVFESARDEYTSAAYTLSDFVTAGATTNYYAALSDVTAPLSLTIDGVLVEGSGRFNYDRHDAATDVVTTVSGALLPTDLTIAAVPESRTWVLLLAGFGTVGASLRRRRWIGQARVFPGCAPPVPDSRRSQRPSTYAVGPYPARESFIG